MTFCVYKRLATSSSKQIHLSHSAVKMANLCKHVAVFGLLIYLELSSGVSGEISAEDVYDLLSRSIFRIENDIDNIKQRMEKVEEKVQGISTTVSPHLDGSAFKETEMIGLKDMNMQAFAIKKTLTAEKLILRDTVETFEFRFSEFKSQIQNEIASINASLKEESEVMFDIVNNSSSKLENGFAELKADLSETTNNMSQFLETMEITMMSNFEVMNKRIVANITMHQSTTQTSLNSFQNSLNSLSSTVSSISYKQTYSIQPELTSLSSRISSVSSSLSSTSSSLSSSISSLSKRIYEEERRTIAFSARMVAADSYYNPGEIIDDFKTIIYQYGNGFDSSTGIFTAPLSGTYLFSVNIASKTDKQAHVVIVKNGILLASAMSQGTDQTGGNTVVTYLNKEDRVWVELASGLQDRYELWMYRNQFTGILID